MSCVNGISMVSHRKYSTDIFIYHQEALTNACADIDALLATGKHIY